MSSRKYRSVGELRHERSRCTGLIQMYEKEREDVEAEIARLHSRKSELGKRINSFQQIVGSCNLWIARKETGQCT